MDNVEQILEFLFDTPPEGAVDYLKSQGYEVSANSDEIINAIKNHAFTVAKVATADKLQKIHDELKKAMDSGTPYKEWLKSVKDTVPGKTNWQTMYRTNMSSAYNSGRYVQQMASTEYMPFWQHFCPIDSRTRPLGHTLNGLIYRYDDPHWQTMYPPNEYNDRDRIGVLSEFAMQQQGLKAETEPPRDKDGKLYEPAKGFRGNPANSTWKPDLSKYSPDIRAELEKALKGKEIKPVEGVLKAEGKEKITKDNFKDTFTNAEFEQYKKKAIDYYSTNKDVYDNFDYYSKNGYLHINNLYRGTGTLHSSLVEPMKKICNGMLQDFKIELKTDTIAYRGIHSRGKPAVNDLRKSLIKGEISTFKEASFLSCSAKKTIAEAFGQINDANVNSILFEIGLPKGTKVGIGNFKQYTEQEFILPPGSEFDIIGISEGNNAHTTIVKLLLKTKT